MTGRPQEAEVAFTEAELQTGTAVGLLHYRRAHCYEYVGNLDAALATYKLAVACDEPMLDSARGMNALERISALEETVPRRGE
jgi:hypothetical protein